MTASPLVQVQYSSDAGVWHETAGGVDASPGDTVSIRIKTATGINKWFLEVFGVDEVTATAPTLTGVSLPTHEVATLGTIVTFVMPSGAGIARAVLIRSLIKFGGYSAVSKFGIFTKTTAGFRVLAVNETFENDLIFGSAVIVNQTIRNIGGGQALTGNLDGAKNAIVNFDNGHSAADVDLNATGLSTLLLTSIFASMTERGLMTASHTYLATIGFRVDIYETSTPTIAGSIDVVIDAVVVTNGANAPTVTFNGFASPDYSRLQGAAAVLNVVGLDVTCASAGAGAGFTISATQPTGIACHASAQYWLNNLKVMA